MPDLRVCTICCKRSLSTETRMVAGIRRLFLSQRWSASNVPISLDPHRTRRWSSTFVEQSFSRASPPSPHASDRKLARITQDRKGVVIVGESCASPFQPTWSSVCLFPGVDTAFDDFRIQHSARLGDQFNVSCAWLDLNESVSFTRTLYNE